VGVLLNTGSGAFAAAVAYNTDPIAPQSVVVGDFGRRWQARPSPWRNGNQQRIAACSTRAVTRGNAVFPNVLTIRCPPSAASAREKLIQDTTTPSTATAAEWVGGLPYQP